MDNFIDNIPDDGVASKMEEIYVALKEIECVRFSKELSEEERLNIEHAAVDLRSEERKLIGSINKDIIEQIKQSSLSLDQLAKRVRERSTKLSKTAKGVDKVTKAIVVVVDIIERLNKQLSLS